jgi:flavin-dependent dehydrogenase
VLEGAYPSFEGIDALYSPRRTILDKILIDAAGEVGAEVREAFTVDEIVIEDGRVIGIRVHERGGSSVTEHARLVVGADGKHSLVAKAVRPAAITKNRLSRLAITPIGRTYRSTAERCMAAIGGWSAFGRQTAD